MTTEFWIGGHQELPIKLNTEDVDSSDTEEYITALSNQIIVVIKHTKVNNVFTKINRYLIDKENNVVKEVYTSPNVPTVIEGDWNSYLASYTPVEPTDKCIKEHDNNKTSFFAKKIYEADIIPVLETLKTTNVNNLQVTIRETIINNNNCIILNNNTVETKVFKLISTPLEDGETIDILGVSPLPIPILYVGGDREPEEVKIQKLYYPNDKVYFYVKSTEEYYIICKNEDRLLGIKRYKEDNLTKFETLEVENPDLLTDVYKIWQSPIANTWTEPDLDNYKKCSTFYLTDTLEGWEAYPYESVTENIATTPDGDITDFTEVYSLDLLQDIKYKDTNNSDKIVVLKELLLDETNTHKYPNTVISAVLLKSNLKSEDTACQIINIIEKKTKLKKLVTSDIKKNQINILASSPIHSTSTSTIRGTSRNSVRIRANRLSNE